MSACTNFELYQLCHFVEMKEMPVNWLKPANKCLLHKPLRNYWRSRDAKKKKEKKKKGKHGTTLFLLFHWPSHAIKQGFQWDAVTMKKTSCLHFETQTGSPSLNKPVVLFLKNLHYFICTAFCLTHFISYILLRFYQVKSQYENSRNLC